MQKTTPLKTCDIIKYHKLPNFGYVDEILKINFSKTCGYLPLAFQQYCRYHQVAIKNPDAMPESFMLFRGKIFKIC
jgi:hypothetical protein